MAQDAVSLCLPHCQSPNCGERARPLIPFVTSQQPAGVPFTQFTEHPVAGQNGSQTPGR